MHKKKVLVLILSYNGKELLEDAIQSYLDNSYENFEVVVIDNGSNDGTEQYVNSEWPEVKVLRTDINLKYSGGFNFGLDYAFNKTDADYVLITNNDVIADERIIDACVTMAESNHRAGFVTGKVYYNDQPNTFQTCGIIGDDEMITKASIGRGETDEGQYDSSKEIDYCDDIFWLVSKNVYEDVGGYNTEFAFQAEDLEWQVRAKKAGYKIYFAHEAKLWHKESMTIGKTSPFKMYHNFRNQLLVRFMHRDYNGFKKYYKYKRRHLIVYSIKSFFRLNFKHIIYSWRGFFSVLGWGLRNKKITFIQIFK